MMHIINFPKQIKVPDGYRIEYWEADEKYHWVIDDDNYSIAFCTRWMALKSAKIHSETIKAE